MNKYQEYLLKDCLGQDFVFYRCCPLINEIEGSATQYGKFDKKTDTFTLTQDEDIHIIEYALIIGGTYLLDIFTSVEVFVNGKWQKIGTSTYDNEQVYRIVINFNNRIEKIKLSFKNSLADDYILNLKYVEADEEKYYAKQAQQKKDELLKTADIKHSTGNDLVNIYFQPCNNEYERTEIILYKDNQLLAKYKVDDGTFFKSITGLAYGTYEYVLKQFDNNGELLLETDKIKFSIHAPNHGGRQTVYWN